MIRRCRIAGLMTWVAWACAPVAGAGDSEFAPVAPGYTLSFPRDYGAHEQFRTEWWYVTGWLRSAQGEDLGFQVTFFRTRLPAQSFGANPSAFASKDILAAHIALSDPAHSRLWLDQRTARTAFGLAGFAADDTRVWIDRWQLQRSGRGYAAIIDAREFSLQLDMSAEQPPQLNGRQGLSQKAAAPRSASYYYSIPHLRVKGRILRSHRPVAVTGEAWLDHEWSSEYLADGAVGWDWAGINLADGSALMAFSIRGKNGQSIWAGATIRSASLQTASFGPDKVRFEPQRRWRSQETGIWYPVETMLVVDSRRFRLVPLMDDQESDTRMSTGSVYWEGAVRASEKNRPAGRGYLELTGYGEPLKLH